MSDVAYAVFAFDDYYPSGGWTDLLVIATTEQAAYKAVANARCDRWQIVDLALGTILDEGRRGGD